MNVNPRPTKTTSSQNLMDDPIVRAFLKDLDEKVEKCQAFHQELVKARRKIIAERELRPDAYTRPITY